MKALHTFFKAVMEYPYLLAIHYGHEPREMCKIWSYGQAQGGPSQQT